MPDAFVLPAPQLPPVLDPAFRPAVLANRAYRQAVAASGGGVPLILALTRDNGKVNRHTTHIFPANHPQAAANFPYVERLLKFLLWQWGGWQVAVAGSSDLARALQQCYTPGGTRAFDAQMWGEFVYQRPFTVLDVAPADLPAAHAGTGGGVRFPWRGWRIGFDLGASDRKVAAVKDGQLALRPDGTPVCSDEFVWDPKAQSDPQWHYQQIDEILKFAWARILEADPGAKLGGIGGSAAGIYVDGRVRNASLFRSVQPRARFEADIAPLFQRLAAAWGVPFRLENDGDVTALAGALALNDGAVLGLAMGSSLAGGYVDDHRCIAGWLNELAFAPIDYQPGAPADEWSGDRGVGANYLSQQAVGRLIPLAGITMDDLPAGALPQRLERVQQLMAAGDPRALRIYQTIGRYFGYAVAHYADFYQPLRYVEVLGRVMTGAGGEVILGEAQQVLHTEFPALAASFRFYQPSEREKRHGQAAAAASLPLA